MNQFLELLVLMWALVPPSEAIPDSALPQLGAYCSQPNMYLCRNSKCILKRQVCNGINDCLDNSDEEHCDETFCSSKDLFKCKNGLCISKNFLCDGENDCGDGSDEKICRKRFGEETCDKGKWMCTDRKCIPEEFFCNGERNCVDGSDEILGCRRLLKCNGFRCENGNCISYSWKCNGYDDCDDNSDEENCPNPRDCTKESQKFLCSNNITCIPLNKVCNYAIDCPDRSDESQFCSNIGYNCNKANCSHDCIMLPTGLTCICPEGHKIINDSICVDIDECQQHGICDQKCHNTQGSYKCLCDYKYNLQADKKTCKLTSGEAIMYFSTKTEIRAYFLRSKKYVSVTSDLKQAVGIAASGNQIYWTDFYAEEGSIFRESVEGTNRELLLTSGLGKSEGIAIDWLTGNIYFTDAEYAHINVCTNNTMYCTVLIKEGIRKPRGIVLSPADGLMYWTDLKYNAEIGRANMDGSEHIKFVTEQISHPNGLALDYPNRRLYWVDAIRYTIESIKLDGTGRYVVLKKITSHPYAIAVFEDTLYWSEWGSHSLKSCNKFTGKNYNILIEEQSKDIFGIHIQYNAISTVTRNPCSGAFCSHICLLKNSNYTCACPQHLKLSPDNHTCSGVEKKQLLVVGAKDSLLVLSLKTFGRHEIVPLPSIVSNLGCLVFDSLHKDVYAYDLDRNSIVKLSLETKQKEVLDLSGFIGKIEDMAYDNYGNNLYWVDSQKKTIEVLSLHSMARKIVFHEMGDDIPQSIALVPSKGIMIVAFSSKAYSGVDIDRFTMDGKHRTHFIENRLQGPIKLAYDIDLHRIFYADAGTGIVTSTNVEGDHENMIVHTSPTSLVFLSENILWTIKNSPRLYWCNKFESNCLSKQIKLDLPEDLKVLHIAPMTHKESTDHICHNNNGNCTYFCLLSNKDVVCACPLGMMLLGDGKTCYKLRRCSNKEYTCEHSNMCVPFSMRCNGNRDCPYGEDEQGCPKKKTCNLDEFMCGDGSCINEGKVCDQHFDCDDKSDETGPGCKDTVKVENCARNTHRCSDGKCLHLDYMCDGNEDCLDGSDERNCETRTCALTQFRCESGECIPSYWECDQEFDCVDLSDEHDYCKPPTCSPYHFTCANGKCIDIKFKCDHVDDCGDLSDELLCNVKPNCDTNNFPCSSNKTICMHVSARCNGIKDCPLGEDEHFCKKCFGESFECKNEKCIPEQWVCDKDDDCGDNSDETAEACSGKSSVANEFIFDQPCEQGYRCQSGKCIDFKLVCNGIDDCFDGSDEHGSCHTACKNMSHTCQTKCIPTPTGERCGCEDGYQLNGDGKTCSDILECSQDPMVCSQKCQEIPGSYKCSCYPGFKLRHDNSSCKGLGEPMSMYFSVHNEIRKLSQADRSLLQIYSSPTLSISGMDVSIKNKQLYYIIKETGTVLRLNLENNTEEHITNTGEPQKMAVDWLTQNVYYYDASSQDKSIKVCNMDKQKCAKVLSFNSRSHVSAMAVDPVNKCIFYTLKHWVIFNSPSTTLYKATLDGSRQEEMVKAFNGDISGITYDLNKKILYYVDYRGSLNSINYNGTNKHVLMSNLTMPSGLNLFEDHIYFLTTAGHMGKCKLYGIQFECETIKLNALMMEHFAINQESRQPQSENPCAKSQCSGVCIPVDVGVKCVCEDGSVVKEDDTCGSISVSSTNKSVMVVGVLVPILIVLAGLIVYMCLKRKRSGNLNIRIRFINSIYGLRNNSANSSNIPLNTGVKPEEYQHCNSSYPDTEDSLVKLND